MSKGFLSPSHWSGLWQFVRNPKTPVAPKIGVVMAILYLVWPLDVIPDVIPLFGWLDDLGLAALALWWLARVAQQHSNA